MSVVAAVRWTSRVLLPGYLQTSAGPERVVHHVSLQKTETCREGTKLSDSIRASVSEAALNISAAQSGSCSVRVD